HADLDEVGRRDLGVEKLVPLDEEHAVLARDPHGAVIVDDVVPAVMRDQPVGGDEVGARLPFVRAHAGWRDRSRQRFVHGFPSRGAPVAAAMIASPDTPARTEPCWRGKAFDAAMRLRTNPNPAIATASIKVHRPDLAAS